jgi:hypothetical protein
MKYGLDQQAVNALHQWTFKPGLKDRKPVAVGVVVVVARFTLTWGGIGVTAYRAS